MHDTSVLKQVQEALCAHTAAAPESAFFATSYSLTTIAHRSTAQDIDYVDHLVAVATSSATGYSFCPHADRHTAELADLLHRDVRVPGELPTCIRVAAIDAAWATLPRSQAHFSCFASGPPDAKAKLRATLIAEEARRVVADIASPRVLLVGAVGSIVSELRQRDMRVFITELDETLVGSQVAGTEIIHGANTVGLLGEVDVAVVTAMTLATETFDDILTAASEHNTRLVMYSESASNFAPQLLNHGIHATVVEHFPFYMFDGLTPMEVFRR